MLERLGWTLSIFLFLVLARQLAGIYQRTKLQTATRLACNGQVSLIVVVSSHCAICPAQKKIVAQACEQYPPSLLRAVTIDAETQPEQARKLAVMTVPSTLLQAADGSIVQVNNGFIALAPLTKQIKMLITQHTSC